MKKIKHLFNKYKQKISDKTYNINGYKVDKFIIDGLINFGFKVEKDNLIVTSPSNLKLRLDFQPYVLFESFTSKDYEFFSNDDDSILIDIGMNAGFISLQFAQKENIKKVYAFEPFLPTYNGALKNIELNKEIADKIETFPYGLSNKNAKMELLYEKGLAGNMSIVKNLYDNSNPVFDTDNANIETIEIKDASEVLGPILERNKDKKILLKCDTEGSEFEIIESLDNSKLLQEVDIILVEYHFKSPKIIETILTENNFVVFYKNGYDPETKCGMIYAVKND